MAEWWDMVKYRGILAEAEGRNLNMPTPKHRNHPMGPGKKATASTASWQTVLEPLFAPGNLPKHPKTRHL